MELFDLDWLADSSSSFVLQNRIAMEQVKPSLTGKGCYLHIVEVDTVAQLNMLVSACRERSEGRVVFRGQTDLYDVHPYPTAYRKSIEKPEFSNGAIALLRALSDDLPVDPRESFDVEKRFDQILEIDSFVRQLQLSERGVPWYALEGLIQQYFGGTRWLDVVDSLWIAIWMASRSYIGREKPQKHHDFDLPVLSVNEFWANEPERKHVFLYFLDCKTETSTGLRGYTKSDNLEILDLRVALPAQFLRPHSQHAMLMKFKGLVDINTNVLAVARVSLQLVREIIGGSSLLATSSIFPSPEDDRGFSAILGALKKYGPFSPPSWRLNEVDLPSVYL